jgi:guanylate kinase
LSNRLLIVFSGPSGTGKSTLIQGLLKPFPELSFTVSCTTRAIRRGEVEGRDYHYLSTEEFQRRIDAGEFVEWEALHENRYGTPWSELQRLWDIRRVPLLDIDVMGALNVKRMEPGARLIFIAPPSLLELERRLRARGTETEQQIRIRLARAEREMAMSAQFDHVVVNDDLLTAGRELTEILNTCIGRTAVNENL